MKLNNYLSCQAGEAGPLASPLIVLLPRTVNCCEMKNFAIFAKQGFYANCKNFAKDLMAKLKD